MEKKGKSLTRIVSAVILFPIAAVIFIFANNLIMDISVAVLSILCLWEYYHCFRSTKKANPSSWIGYVVCAMIGLTHFASPEVIKGVFIGIIPVSLLILMCEMVLLKGKKNIMDVAVTIFGICYIPMMTFFLSMIRAIEPNGKLIMWYAFLTSWGSDIFAYFIGKNFGKHKFTEISPNKSIEGCIAGIVGATVLSVLYTLAINQIFTLEINVLAITIISIGLAFVGQIGDLMASSIKRYCGMKDFSELIPGHGGMLDRFDSVIFIMPFAYISMILFII